MNIKKIATNGDPIPGLEQAEKCGGVEPVSGILTLGLLLIVSSTTKQIASDQAFCILNICELIFKDVINFTNIRLLKQHRNRKKVFDQMFFYIFMLLDDLHV